MTISSRTLSSRTIGTGRPMVLLPWFSLDAGVMAAAFEPAIGGLSGWARRYVDLPGCGGSAPVAPSSDAVVSALVADLETLAAPVTLVGCSYGGYLAAAVARRRPDLVSALAMVCSGVRIGLADRTLPDVPRTVPLSWPTDVDRSVRSHLDLALGTDDSDVAAQIADLISSGPRSDDAFLTQLREHGYQLTDEQDQSPYTGPVLMITGRQDRVGGYVDQFEAMSRYPHGSYVCLEGAGHYVPFEQPDVFGAIFRHWLDSLGAA